MSPEVVVTATIKKHATVIVGEVGSIDTEIMLDSGSSVSLIRRELLPCIQNAIKLPVPSQPQLVTASGEPLLVVDHVKAKVKIKELQIVHDFLVVDSLVVPVILGIKFLQENRLVLDFSCTPVGVRVSEAQPEENDQQGGQWKAVWTAEHKCREKICAALTAEDAGTDAADECSVPRFSGPDLYDIPECEHPSLAQVVDEFLELFKTKPGKTMVEYHYISTTGCPVKVPPRRIPAHYREEVKQQLQDMLNQGIIQESSSPWMAPAVYVPKKSGEIRLCVDYRELNKKTTKDAYPLPLPDEVQDRLEGSTMFSTLDLQCGYWQMPVNPDDRAKTAFCPGPGMGLFEFTRMPFGLTGAPSSFQRLMDKLFRDIPFVTTYIDDVLVHSKTEELHMQHLHEVFRRLKEAGLTLRGKKCHIGRTEVPYLGHVFSATGMAPDQEKVRVVREWPVPSDVTEVRRFLGLASYYRRYIHQFSDIAAPLHSLTQKGVPFVWTPECQTAFTTLKEKLTQAPILVYPRFDSEALPFVLQTDASSVGVGAVLEQGGKVVAYASRTLTKSERQYSVIQRECLATVYGMKQFRHYLLGRSFTLVTDHAPLQWLSAQKMEGLLCRWSLAIQEYDFTMLYRKGSLNTNADALSRCVNPEAVSASTQIQTRHTKEELITAQQNDPVVRELSQALHQNSAKPTKSGEWGQSPLIRYRQLWPQLTLVEGIVCRKYTPGPTKDLITVPIIPDSLRQKVLYHCHDSPTAGHQGIDKTLERLRKVAYWVNMAQDVEKHCRECLACQKSKLPKPTKAPLVSMPIGKPWQMVAVDILEVPVSNKGNRYLLVVQDYFTKWADAIPLRNQTAATITEKLVKLFSVMGLPDILHSDQGRNFESTLLQQTLEAFGTVKSHTTAYHPEGDGMVERFNRSLLQLLRSYVENEADWERHLPLVLYAYRTSVHSSTGIEPYVLMFGRQPHTAKTGFEPSVAYDASSYKSTLQAKMAELVDFVESKLASASADQKRAYDKSSTQRSFKVNDPVWLSIPTAGKLDPRWEGDWEVVAVKGPVNVKISDGERTKIVHINRLQHRILPSSIPTLSQTFSKPVMQPWNPPQVEHFVEPEVNTPQLRHSQRSRTSPDYYRPDARGRA